MPEPQKPEILVDASKEITGAPSTIFMSAKIESMIRDGTDYGIMTMPILKASQSSQMDVIVI